MWQALIEQLSERLHSRFEIDERVKVISNHENNCYVITNGCDKFFVKTSAREFLPQFEAEARSLLILGETSTIRVPKCYLTGTSHAHSFIVLDYLQLSQLEDPSNSFELGAQLAKLHGIGDQKEYGFDTDNYLADTLQPNQWNKKWARFFSEQRIGWQLQLLSEKGLNLGDIDTLVEFVYQKLANHQPKPSLLHGDFWFGNVGNTEHGAFTFDAASYWGDAECDVAMAELFGGFEPEFYQGYESVLPLASEYQYRKHIYNLYHLLNHCNLFGGHYVEDAENAILWLTQNDSIIL
jgi:fructosamine-3-kinase